MRRASNYTRILAVDLRSRRFGFVVLEGPRNLLEWGVKSYRTDAHDIGRMVLKRITPILTFFSPAVIVVRQANGADSKCSHRDLIMNAIQYEALRLSVELVVVKREEISCLFGKSGCTTKYEIAGQMAVLFPELIWKLPPVRKSWMRERHTMTIFDAVSTGLAYLARSEDVFFRGP